MAVDDEHRGDAAMKSFSLEDALPEQPPAFKFALQLTFSLLSHVLQWPTRKSSQYSRSNLNPYLAILLTFLSTVLKHCPTLECSIPWEEFGVFFATVPRKIMITQGLIWDGMAARCTSTGSGRVARNAKRSLRFWRPLTVANSRTGRSRTMTVQNTRKRAHRLTI